MKKYLLFLLGISVLVIPGCGGDTDENIEDGSGTVLSGEEQLEEFKKSNEENAQESLDEDISDSNAGDVIEQEESVEEKLQAKVNNQSWFGVDECNRIIDFNLCVIEKAPIENQPIMKESLQMAIESRKLMANAQLREICSDVLQQDTFKEVVDHYRNLEDGCSY